MTFFLPCVVVRRVLTMCYKKRTKPITTLPTTTTTAMIDHRWWCAFEEKSRKNVVMSKSSSNVFEARERVEEKIVKNLLEK